MSLWDCIHRESGRSGRLVALTFVMVCGFVSCVFYIGGSEDSIDVSVYTQSFVRPYHFLDRYRETFLLYS
jgi:hypothetical protein